MSTNSMSILLVCAAFAVGCKHDVPVELAAARQAYVDASAGPAPQVVPAELHKAQVALEVAEQSFADDPRGYETRDLAYVAQRTSQKADALARIALEKQTAEDADKQYSATQTAIVRETREELAMSQESGAKTAAQLESTSAALSTTSAALTTTSAALTTAEAARREADQRTAAALAALATVKEEQRGMVITLSGSVLFRSNEASLLPAAQTKLNEVATALLATKERTLLVEGHTDAEGDDASNLDLSQRRAEAVRMYLIDRGYDAARIEARGIGEARPVADNESPEGKANNRRVEIVVGK